MRVLHLTHNYPRFPGDPSGAFLEQLLSVAAREAVELTVLCPHAQGLAAEEFRSGVRIVRFKYASEDAETLAYEGKMLDALRKGIKELRLLARAVFIIDRDGVIRFANLVKEMTEEPNYDSILATVKEIV